VDTDVALGARTGDVDDGFALAAVLAAARRGTIELLGISTVSGNTEASQAAECARSLASVAASAVRIVCGWDAPGGAADAAAALASLSAGSALVALGPLSNVAAAIAADPGLPGRVELSVVGGNLNSSGFLPPLWPHEFNLARDRFSSLVVLRAGWRRLLFYPLDVVRRLRCSRARLARIYSYGAAGAHLALESERWLTRTRWRHGPAGFPVWDLPAALAAAGALQIRVEPRVFPRPQRRFAGIPPCALAAVDFDPAAAWSAFEGLLSTFR
jgi:purine nucleosidase